LQSKVFRGIYKKNMKSKTAQQQTIHALSGKPGAAQFFFACGGIQSVERGQLRVDSREVGAQAHGRFKEGFGHDGKEFAGVGRGVGAGFKPAPTFRPPGNDRRRGLTAPAYGLEDGDIGT
jgi:hypothetical protein